MPEAFENCDSEKDLQASKWQNPIHIQPITNISLKEYVDGKGGPEGHLLHYR